MPEIVVAIPTFQRPQGLEKLLQALGELVTDRELGVIVADNDAVGHQGADLCDRMKDQGYRWGLDTIVVPERGIAQARNALV
ncbi:MAG: glycosyl transferase, partial [Rhizomicrobium sp.]